jgi:hypothetical protein
VNVLMFASLVMFAAPQPSYTVERIALYVSAAADIITTRIAIRKGSHEGNPHRGTDRRPQAQHVEVDRPQGGGPCRNGVVRTQAQEARRARIRTAALLGHGRFSYVDERLESSVGVEVGGAMQVGSNTKVTFGFSDKDHPVWGILKPLVLTACVGLLLYTFADSFDKTEVKTIIGTLLGSIGLEGINAVRRR